MKSRFHVPLVLALAVFCGWVDRSHADTNTSNTVRGQNLKDKYKDAASATKDYVAQNKDQFVTSMKQKLKELDKKIDELAKKSEPYKDQAKAKADKALAKLREQRQAAGEQFEKLKQSSTNTWEHVKSGVNTAVSKLQDTYEKVKDKFN